MREKLVLLLVVSWLCVGCTTMVDVRVDQREDLSGLRTWNWLPSGASAEMGVDAPQRDAPALHASLGRLIAEKLRAGGFERSERADFFVIFHLVLAPRKLAVQVPRAPYLLSSLSSGPSYWIEGSDEEIRVYEDFRLVIGLLSEPGRILWRGVLERKVNEGQDLSLDAAVADLLERLQPSAPSREADPPREPDTPDDPPRGGPHLT